MFQIFNLNAALIQDRWQVLLLSSSRATWHLRAACIRVSPDQLTAVKVFSISLFFAGDNYAPCLFTSPWAVLALQSWGKHTQIATPQQVDATEQIHRTQAKSKNNATFRTGARGMFVQRLALLHIVLYETIY